MKFYFKYIFEFIILLSLIQQKGKINNANVKIGQAIVPNECSSLGLNNPLRLLDCSIFKLEKGLCCLLTITIKENMTDCDGEDVCQTEEIFKTACIVLSKKDSKIINETSSKYKSLGDVLIECSQDYIPNSIIFVFILFFFLDAFFR